MAGCMRLSPRLVESYVPGAAAIGELHPKIEGFVTGLGCIARPRPTISPACRCAGSCGELLLSGSDVESSEVETREAADVRPVGVVLVDEDHGFRGTLLRIEEVSGVDVFLEIDEASVAAHVGVVGDAMRDAEAMDLEGGHLDPAMVGVGDETVGAHRIT